MADPVFRARTAPILPPEAQALVDAYEATYGASGPGCCPAALAAVLEALADEAGLHDSTDVIGMLDERAEQLRGQA